MTLSELKKGEQGIIESLIDEEFSAKLMELGFLPGETVRVDLVAPLGDPVAVTVAGYQISLRKSEAACIMLRRPSGA